ncbi:MAG: hypothetical protein JW704_10900 [Anaerolineaceae bacterium]|nr:hypothetical protein [Anaerolineaceae bacterium]
MIRHAIFAVTDPLTVKPLAVTVIEPAFGTLLVAAIGLAPLLSASLLAAAIAAITLPSVTGSADVEDRSAPANSLAQ